MKTKLEEIKTRHAKELAELEAKERILAMLPETLPTFPTVSNISEKGPIHAWLSFSPEYSQDGKAFALSVLSELEAAGFKPLPASLCKWGNYRRSASPGLTTDIPEEKRGCFGSTDKLTDVEPIAPLWVEPNQYTGAEVRCFYEKDGRIFKVTVKAPFQAFLQCRRQEYNGGWRYDGPCTVQFPQAWHSIHTDSGESVAHISAHTHGYRDTEQGISGTIYWQPLTEQESFPLTPAQFLTRLFTA